MCWVLKDQHTRVEKGGKLRCFIFGGVGTAGVGTHSRWAYGSHYLMPSSTHSTCISTPGNGRNGKKINKQINTFFNSLCHTHPPTECQARSLLPLTGRVPSAPNLRGRITCIPLIHKLCHTPVPLSVHAVPPLSASIPITLLVLVEVDPFCSSHANLKVNSFRKVF